MTWTQIATLDRLVDPVGEPSRRARDEGRDPGDGAVHAEGPYR